MSRHELRCLPGKFAPPIRGSRHLPPWPCVASALDNPSVVLAADSDFVSLGRLAAAVVPRSTPTLWIRLDVTDTDPDVFVSTVADAVASLDAETSNRLHRVVRKHIGREEWDLAGLAIADGIHRAAAGPATVVLEGVDHRESTNACGSRFVLSSLLSRQRDATTLVVVGSADPECWSSALNGVLLRNSDLRIDLADARYFADTYGYVLGDRSLCRLLELSNGGAGFIEAILSAGAALGPYTLEALIERAGHRTDLLNEVGADLLRRSDLGTLTALAAASRLGVWQPRLDRWVSPYPPRRCSAWWLDLADGSLQLAPVWRDWLRQNTGAIESSRYLDVADRLVADGMPVPAVELYAAAGRTDRALETASMVAGELVKRQQWHTLDQLRVALCRGKGSGETIERRDVATQLGRRSASVLDHRCLGPSGPALLTRAPDSGLESIDSRDSDRHSPPASTSPAQLTVHLFGPTRASLDDRPVQSWVSGRGRAVFEYLVVHRRNPTSRERLMGIFWPDVNPESARNSLNVAIHGLRQALRSAGGEQAIVIHRNRSYLFEPGVDVWLDVEAFEQHLKSARQHLTANELDAAEYDFEAAIGLYQGEFLADDPYEEWAVVTREHLRLAHLDGLDQLGAMRFDSGNYGGAAELCLKMLAYDNCSEDAHCRLMRCYSRRGQPQLALRQYHACVTTLRSELRMEPAASTTELFRRIQRRDDV
jgi:DNA-binding SARP family transcriptional activator